MYLQMKYYIIQNDVYILLFMSYSLMFICNHANLNKIEWKKITIMFSIL